MKSELVKPTDTRGSSGYIARIYIRVFAISLVIPLIVLAPVLMHPSTTFIGVAGDSQQTMWFMGWFWHGLMTGQNPLVSRLINYPNGINLMDNTSVVAEGLLFGPLKWLVSSAFMYDAMIFVNLYVTGIIGFFILREFGARRSVSLTGGVAMQLLPYTSAQMAGHANLTVTMWVFAAFYVALRVVNGHIKNFPRAGFIIALLLAGEFYTSLEILMTTAMVLIMGLVIGLLIVPRRTHQLLRQVSPKFYISAVIGCVILMLPGLYYFEWGPYLSRTFIPSFFSNRYVNDLATFVFPSPAYLFSPVYVGHFQGALTFAQKLTGNFEEQDGYLGMFGIILLIWAVRSQWKEPFVRVFSVLVVVIAILSMGTHLHIGGYVTRIPMPWGVFAKLPMIGQILPSRLMFFADILVVVLLFTAVEQLLQRNTQKRTRRNIRLSLAIFFLTWLPVLPYPSSITPLSFAAISPHGAMYQRIQGMPTLILTNNFFEVMQGLADSNYGFPSVTVYGFQNNSPSQIAYRPLSYYGWPKDRTGKALTDYLKSALASTKAQRVLIIPVRDDSPPATLIHALTQICGEPVRDTVHDAYVWKVPKQLSAFWFDGDVSDPGTIIDSELTGKAGAAGADWIYVAHGETRRLTFIAPSAQSNNISIKLHLTGALEKDVFLQPGQSISVVVGGNQSLGVQVSHLSQGDTPSGTQSSSDVEVLVRLSFVK